MFKKLVVGAGTVARASRAEVDEPIAARREGKRPSTKSEAYQKASIASLVHWLDVAERAELVYHMPHAEIRSLRDKCERILAGRIARRSREFDDDPLRRWL